MGQWPADGGSSEIKFGREEPVHLTGMFTVVAPVAVSQG